MRLNNLFIASACFFSLSYLFGIESPLQSNEKFRTVIEDDFITRQEELKKYVHHEKVVLIASPGRSGSTLLTDITKKYADDYTVLKSHTLPPSTKFKGKILFIFSNPDKAAESALHRLLLSKSGGRTHFLHVESADQKWFNAIGRNARNQTEKHNLLSYDALGCKLQLEQWLYNKTEPCSVEAAQILAVKLENLWDEETVEAIKLFLGINHFKLPPKVERGYDASELRSEELLFRSIYNLGTKEQPRYEAYDKARVLWENAAPFSFLKLVRR